MQIPYSVRVGLTVVIAAAVIAGLLIDKEDFLCQGRDDLFPDMNIPMCKPQTSSDNTPMQAPSFAGRHERVSMDQKESVTYYTVVDDPYALDPI